MGSSGTSLEFRLDKPTAKGIPALFAGAVIAALLALIAAWPTQPAHIPPVALGMVILPSAALAWIAVRRRKILIDPEQHRVTRQLSALGIVIRRTVLDPQQIDRIVVEGHAEENDTSARVRRFWDQPPRGASPRFAICLEGPIGRLELAGSDDHVAAERQALTVAQAAGLPVIRRGYYLGKPREGAINRIHSEEAWELALTRGVVITGDPSDSGDISPPAPPTPSPLLCIAGRGCNVLLRDWVRNDSWGLGLRASPLLATTQPVAGAVGTTPTPCIVRHRSRTTMWSVCTACPHPRSTSSRSRKCVQPAP